NRAMMVIIFINIFAERRGVARAKRVLEIGLRCLARRRLRQWHVGRCCPRATGSSRPNLSSIRGLYSRGKIFFFRCGLILLSVRRFVSWNAEVRYAGGWLY